MSCSRTPSAAGGVVAELQGVEVPDQQQRDGHQHGQASSSSGMACSQPRPLREPLSQTWALAASSMRAWTSSHEVTGGQRRAEADADQDQPLAVDAAPPGQQRRARPR